MRIPATVQAEWPTPWLEAHLYDRLEFGGDNGRPGYTLAYRNRFALTMEFVRRAAPSPAQILDVAAAQGNLSLALAEAGHRVTWNDLRGELADYVRLKYERGIVDYRPGNAFELTFPEPFDVVVATEIIEHVAHPDVLLLQLARFVRRGGYAVITTPNGGYFRNSLPRFSECPDPSIFENRQFGPGGADHVFLLDEDELRALAESAGWSVIESRLFTSFVLNGHCRTDLLLRALPEKLVQAGDRLLQSLPRSWREHFDVGLGVLLQRN